MAETSNIKMMICKQCGRELPENHFKEYTSRSTGQRSSTVSRYTICKTCEKMDAYAAKLHKRFVANNMSEEDIKDRESLMYHYQRQIDAGREIVTAAARRLMGLPELTKRRGAPSKLSDLLASYDQPVDIHQYRDANSTGNSAAIRRMVNNLCDDSSTDDTVELQQKMETLKDEQQRKDMAERLETVVENVDETSPMTFEDRLERLLKMPLTEEPDKYDLQCDALMCDIRSSNNGQIPPELIVLASEVLDRLDEYANNYNG